jgi:hypothetical protein
LCSALNVTEWVKIDLTLNVLFALVRVEMTAKTVTEKEPYSKSQIKLKPGPLLALSSPEGQSAAFTVTEIELPIAAIQAIFSLLKTTTESE